MCLHRLESIVIILLEGKMLLDGPNLYAGVGCLNDHENSLLWGFERELFCLTEMCF